VYERSEAVRLKKVGGQWRITSYFFPDWSRGWEVEPRSLPGPRGGG